MDFGAGNFQMAELSGIDFEVVFRDCGQGAIQHVAVGKLEAIFALGHRTILGRSKVGRANRVGAKLERLSRTARLPAEGICGGAIAQDAAEIIVVVQVQHRADRVGSRLGATRDCGARERDAQNQPTELSARFCIGQRS